MSLSACRSLTEAACAVLAAADPADKVTLTHAAAAAWRDGRLDEVGLAAPPPRPARPPRPDLLPPNRMPRRKYGDGPGKVALLHALAHIELNAIDLAWDIIARFTGDGLPRAFYDDWVAVAVDEAEHFEALRHLLRGLGHDYGDLPAHDGLWEAAARTADDLRARLAVVPMTLEARGLDTTPVTLERLARNGETAALPVLEQIYRDEIRHVAAGVRWFRFLCQRENSNAAAMYHHLIGVHMPGGLKPPFNEAARAEAGFPPEFWAPL